MMKRMLTMIALLVIFFGALFGWRAYVARVNSLQFANGFPPATISATVARAETWSPSITGVGSLQAAQGVNVTAQTPGIITGLHFESGAEVNAGDLLVQQFVDDDIARRKGLQAELRLAEINLERARELVRDRLVPQLDLDTAESNLDRIQADLENVQVTIEKKSIRAPFAGRLGIRRVDIGQYIEPGDDIVSLRALNQILLNFPLPQQLLPQVGVGQAVTVTVDAYPEQVFAGVISAIEPEVDRNTRNFRLQATVPNDSLNLRPGMFAEVQVKLAAQEEVVTVPQAAITYNPYGDSVFVIEETTNEQAQSELTVRNSFVITGAVRGDQVAIVTGVTAGDRIVTSGQLKLRNGSQVLIDNSVLVSDSAEPVPQEN